MHPELAKTASDICAAVVVLLGLAMTIDMGVPAVRGVRKQEAAETSWGCQLHPPFPTRRSATRAMRLRLPRVKARAKKK